MSKARRRLEVIHKKIAHDYEGVNLSVTEHVIRKKLPKIKKTIEYILKEED